MEPGVTVGGRYSLDGRLGEGGMGQVYRARHLQLGKAFALKIISPAFALDQAARARFNEEAKLASEISHPNIVSVVDFGEDPHFGAYMVMELVEGEPLLNEGGAAMSVRRAIDILGQIADALDHIHRRGIVHGDVKADNIMLTAENSGARRRRIARLLDFGLARRSGGDDEEEISGSPHYLAPERAAGGPPSVSADIYALGVLGYLMVTGTLPFDGNVVEILMAHINEPPERPSRRRRPGDELDEALENLILRAMAKDPAQRHGSAAAFRYELNTVMDMLDMGRRRRTGVIKAPETPREATLTAAFERSRVPQALVSIEGRIEFANKAFGRLLGANDDETIEGLSVTETTLTSVVPGLMRALKAAHNDGTPAERRARVFRGDDKPALELTLWFSPLPLAGTEIHLMIRVEEEDPRKRARESGGY
ncbi:MAG: protein kinase [Kofleriaceae bacterium]|nr:protein kinase [Kofleriaceae bacterium]